MTEGRRFGQIAPGGAVWSSLLRVIASLCAVVAVLALGSCGGPGEVRPVASHGGLWGGRPEAGAWTKAAYTALDRQGAPLVAMVPDDIAAWCPGYPRARREARKAFWTAFLSELARYESTWNPEAAGGGGRWLGLLQISPDTAQGYGCRAQSAGALRDGALNLSCGIRIMAETVPRDGVIAAGGGGAAADWGPLLRPDKRAAIQAATRARPACRL